MKTAEILAQEMFSLLNQLGAIRTDSEDSIYLANLKECFREVRESKFSKRICKRGFYQKFSPVQQKHILEALYLDYKITPPF